MPDFDISELLPLWSALFGYAIGTAQILALEWFRTRSLHRKHLRLIRAELRRIKAFNSRFDWKGKLPVGPIFRFPRAPSVSPAYVDTVTATDFPLTDEHDDDNLQQALLTLIDGCSALQYASDSVHKLIDEANSAPTPAEKAHAVQAIIGLTERYDQDRGRLEEIVDECLRDVERRFKDARFWSQVRRTIRRKPAKTPSSTLKSGEATNTTVRIDSEEQLSLIKPDA